MNYVHHLGRWSWTFLRAVEITKVQNDQHHYNVMEISVDARLCFYCGKAKICQPPLITTIIVFFVKHNMLHLKLCEKMWIKAEIIQGNRLALEKSKILNTVIQAWFELYNWFRNLACSLWRYIVQHNVWIRLPYHGCLLEQYSRPKLLELNLRYPNFSINLTFSRTLH